MTILCVSLPVTEIGICLCKCVEYEIFTYLVRHSEKKIDNYYFKSEPENVFEARHWEIELRATLECWLQSIVSLLILL